MIKNKNGNSNEESDDIDWSKFVEEPIANSEKKKQEGREKEMEKKIPKLLITNPEVIDEIISELFQKDKIRGPIIDFCAKMIVINEITTGNELKL